MESAAAVGLAAGVGTGAGSWLLSCKGDIGNSRGEGWLAREGVETVEVCLATLAFSCWILLRSELLSLTFLGWAAGSGDGMGAGLGARTGAEAGGGVERDAGCGGGGVGDDDGEGTDVVMEGIGIGGGCAAVDRGEEGEADDRFNEGEEGHGCVGEGQDVDSPEDGTGAMGVEAALEGILKATFAAAILEAG